MIGSNEDQSVHVREIVLDSLYPTLGPLMQSLWLWQRRRSLLIVHNLKEEGMRP
jgi:hypothetical protein